MTTRFALERTRAVNQLGLPPPLALDLFDGDRVVGWIAGDSVGFRGFANELEAANAAWIAYRTVARRLARRRGARPVAVDTEPLALVRRGDEEMILASGREVAMLVRPGAESRSGPDSFGFEIRIPPPGHELTVRAKAQLVYRTLRKSGVRWAMWQPASPRLTSAEVATAPVRRADGAAARRGAGSPSPSVFVATIVLAAMLVGLAIALVAAVPRAALIPLALALGAAGLAGLLALRLVPPLRGLGAAGGGVREGAGRRPRLARARDEADQAAPQGTGCEARVTARRIADTR